MKPPLANNVLGTLLMNSKTDDTQIRTASEFCGTL